MTAHPLSWLGLLFWYLSSCQVSTIYLEIRAPSQYKDGLRKCGDIHCKDKTTPTPTPTPSRTTPLKIYMVNGGKLSKNSELSKKMGTHPLSTTDDILGKWRKFVKKWMNKQRCGSEIENYIINHAFSEAECFCCRCALKSNKFPGIDGVLVVMVEIIHVKNEDELKMVVAMAQQGSVLTGRSRRV